MHTRLRRTLFEAIDCLHKPNAWTTSRSVLECGAPACTLDAFAARSARSSSGRSAMFVATTAADCSKLRRSGMNEGFGTPDPVLLDEPRGHVAPTELFDPCSGVAINMALLTEPLAAPA